MFSFSFWPLLLPLNRYRPTVLLNVVQAELGYSSQEDCLKFLQEKGAVLSEDSTKLDCKASSIVVTWDGLNWNLIFKWSHYLLKMGYES